MEGKNPGNGIEKLKFADKILHLTIKFLSITIMKSNFYGKIIYRHTFKML
jgi:hypothetical protein